MQVRARQPDERPVRLVHIATISNSFRFLSGQPRFFGERGIQTSVIASPGEYGSTFAERESVAFERIPMQRRLTPMRDVVALARLVRSLRKSRPDIVHAHTPKGGLLGMIAARLTGVPVRIYHIRGLPFVTASGWKRKLLVSTEKIACSMATRVLAVSHSMQSLAYENNICPPGSISVIGQGSGNGVDASERFNPDILAPDARETARRTVKIPQSAVVISYLGRLVTDKGIRELSEAWAALRENFSDVWLLIAGPVENNPKTETIISEFREDRRVRMIGPTDNPRDVFVASDVFVLPTYREGFPNVILEAAAMGVPTVATRVPGCVDAVIDKETGLLVPARDAVALADAIGTLIVDRALAASLARRAQARVREQFRPEQIWHGLLDIYTRELRAAKRDRTAIG